MLAGLARTRLGPLFTTGLIVAMSIPGAAQQPEPREPDAESLFVHRVLPLLKSKCFACHGGDPDELRGEFKMLTREGLLAGGESDEPALVPGKPENSPLVAAIKWEGLEMPPKENDRLSAEQIRDVELWIAGGAPWPTAERAAELLRVPATAWDAPGGITVKTSGGLADEWTHRKYLPENLWAYQPLWADETGRLSGDRHPIDVLIGERLESLGLSGAPAADRRTLIRRATFDLIGLPPTAAEVKAFLADPASDAEAFSRVIDRLLESPQYGEQWARHWLDVVRYADSSGYANDYERGNAWRYRDYVVRALNTDKPYDQFIREQIAGDESADAGAENASEAFIAAGFLRMGPWELTGMEVAKVARQRFLDDVTDAVGQIFLAHMLQCARCHDHKFDPIPTRDYYSMQAIFATTQIAERDVPFLAEENTSGFDEREYLELRREHYQQSLNHLAKKQTLDAARDWYAERGLDTTNFERIVGELQKKEPGRTVGIVAIRKEMARQEIDPATIPPRHVGFAPQDFGLERVSRKGLERLRWRMDRYEPIAFSVYSGRTRSMKSVNTPQRMPKSRQNGELEKTAILVGGDPFSPKEPVAPGTLSAAASISGAATSIRTAAAGRRTDLAEWIASADNPLTARVMVNRVWQWHFGQALAGNPNNFGTTGQKPTHPELLDTLARRFMEEGWSIKAMHRLMMSSEAYRRGTRHPDPQALAERDPDGTSYAAFRPRRLAAEELRDAMLRVSGELNLEVGGIPVRPEMNLEAALQPRQVMGTFAEAWQPSPRPEQRHRRSLYALRIRGQRDPFLEVFNAPPPDLSCEAREASTITPQVFALFNSESTFDRALALANRVVGEGGSRAAMIERVFLRCYGRPATPDEIAACVEHWSAMTVRHESLNFEKPRYPHEVVRRAVEENTGEKFEFVEPLEFFADFVPDLKASDVNARIRGLAEVCLVLLNSNEFVYVY